MSESLTAKTVKGIGWNSVDKILNYGVSFIVGIVLARLLSPTEYGLIGIVMIFISIFNTVLDGGLSTALIRKEQISNEDLCTAFFTNIVLSFILTAILFWGAPYIASFFYRNELVEIIQGISVVLLINGFSITQQSILTKRMDFKSQTIISIVSNVTSGIVGIILAFLEFGVWALVYQQIVSRFLTTMLLWLTNKWFPKFIYSKSSFIDLFSFSWKLLISRLLTSIWGRIYNAVIGKIYSPISLGLYTRAEQYAHMFSSTISDVVLKVSLPVMSSIQNDRERLLFATRTIIKETMFITCFCMFFLAASANALIYVLIGDAWMDCVPFLQIVCFNVIVNPLTYINENLLIVEGKSDKLLIVQIMKIVATIPPILIGIFFNIYAMLISSSIIAWLSIVLYTYYTNKYFGYGWRDQLKDIFPSVLISLVIGIIVYSVNFFNISYFQILFIQLIIGIFLLVSICEIFKVQEYFCIKKHIMFKFKN